MLAQLSLDQTFILSIWLEVLLYGSYFSLFCASLYITLQKKNYRSVPSKVMFITSIIMFMLATLHLATNLFRLLQGYVRFRDAPGGPPAYYGDLAKWDHVLKDTLYGTQSLIGDGLSVYRCWLVWDGNYYIIALPLVLMICSVFSGYYTCYLFTKVTSMTVFDHRIQSWIQVFYSVALAQNLMTTTLIAFCIWRRERALSAVLHTSGRSSLVPIIRILVESAAIYVVAQLILLVLYVLNLNAQYLVLEGITPTAGIAFTSITVRLSLRSSKSANVTSLSGLGAAGGGNPAYGVPMKPLAVRVTRNVQDDLENAVTIGSDDGRSFTVK